MILPQLSALTIREHIFNFFFMQGLKWMHIEHPTMPYGCPWAVLNNLPPSTTQLYLSLMRSKNPSLSSRCMLLHELHFLISPLEKEVFQINYFLSGMEFTEEKNAIPVYGF